jgi:iron complex outermembrane receptor protein
MGGKWLAMLIGAVLAFALFSGEAQSQSASGGIVGVVADQSGGVVQRATISVENERTGARRVVHSDDGGRYYALQLAPGPYRVSAQIEGFETEIRRGIVVTVGRESELNLVL